jgi:hypothetical protein
MYSAPKPDPTTSAPLRHVFVDARVILIPLQEAALDQALHPLLDELHVRLEARDLPEHLELQIGVGQQLAGLHHAHDGGVHCVASVLLHAPAHPAL